MSAPARGPCYGGSEPGGGKNEDGWEQEPSQEQVGKKVV